MQDNINIMNDDAFQRAAQRTRTEIKLVYACESCKIDSMKDKGRMCPCPRGECDAKVIGRQVVTTKFYKLKP